MDMDRAVESLYRVPLADFVAERGRLAAELRAAGDKSGAADLAKRRRPTVSAWVVNQLHWHARQQLDRLVEAASRLRKGDLEATGDHREAMAGLRKRAAALLTDGGHGASEAMLRRITTTLSAIAANGGFDPDPPGALIADRDPPGFEVMLGSQDAVARKPLRPVPAPPPARLRRDAEADERRAAERAEQKRRQEEAARRAVERRRVEIRLRTAQAELARRERAVESARDELRRAEEAVERGRGEAEQLERELTSLATEDEG
jgi:DNA repair exonuclease SbcCD ATPase subunit